MCYHYTTSASLKQHALDVSSGALVLDHILSSTLAGNRIRGSSCFLSLRRRRKQSFIFRQVFLLSLFLGFRIQFINSNFIFVIFSLDLERKEGPNRAIQSYARVLVSVPPKKKKKKKNVTLSFQAESEKSERRLSDLDRSEKKKKKKKKKC